VKLLCDEFEFSLYINNESKNGGFVDFYHIPWIFSPPTYRYIGPLTQYSFSPYDFGLIEAICPNTSITTIINNFPSRIYRELFIKEVKSITTIGVHVCKSGYTSYATCGFVLNINAKIIGLDVDNNTSVKEGMMLTNLYFDEGDSGSPVYQYSKSLPYVPVVGIGIVGEVGPSLAGVLHLDVILRHYQLVVVVTP
ncbi:5630_t:CDS:2, partial [Gigaspora rosea]